MLKINLKTWPKSIWLSLVIFSLIKLIDRVVNVSVYNDRVRLVIFNQAIISFSEKYRDLFFFLDICIFIILPVTLIFYFLLFFVFKSIREESVGEKIKFWRFTFSRFLLFYYVYLLSIFYIHISFCVFACVKGPSTNVMLVLAPIWYIIFCLIMKLVILLAKKIGFSKVKFLFIIFSIIFALPFVVGTVQVYPNDSSSLAGIYYKSPIYFYLPGGDMYGSKDDGICLGIKFTRNDYKDVVGCVGYVAR